MGWIRTGFHCNLCKNFKSAVSATLFLPATHFLVIKIINLHNFEISPRKTKLWTRDYVFTITYEKKLHVVCDTDLQVDMTYRLNMILILILLQIILKSHHAGRGHDLKWNMFHFSICTILRPECGLYLQS